MNNECCLKRYVVSVSGIVTNCVLGWYSTRWFLGSLECFLLCCITKHECIYIDTTCYSGLIMNRCFGPNVVGSQFRWQILLRRRRWKRCIGRPHCASILIRFSRKEPVFNKSTQQKRFLISLRYIFCREKF